MIAGERVVELTEAVEYLPFFVIRNTSAGIDDIKLKELIFSGIAKFYASLTGEFQGILDEVGQNLVQLQA